MITYRDWFSTSAFESGHIVPDPSNPNIVYSIGWYGTVFRLDRTTGQFATVFAPAPKYRYTWETPLTFSPRDPKTLYTGMQYVLKSSDDAQTWTEISPDLTTKTPQPNDRGVITTIAASAAQTGELWVGTSTGLVQVTRDNGGSWNEVTPAAMPANSSITLIEASPTDPETAFVVSAGRNDLHPYIFRTRDGGKTWQTIVNGLPIDAVARVVREDPQRKGLLFGGTEKGPFVSFDNGDHWQSLQSNLPTVSVRDLNVHGGDLVAATYGRSLWILDDISPLRQLATEPGPLFKPAEAIRTCWDNHPDTPVPPETPHGDNPPDGAIIYYYLKSAPKKIQLEIRDAAGSLIRQFSDTPAPTDSRPKNVPDYWFSASEVLTKNVGLNRFVWNLQWPHPDVLPYNFYGQLINYIEYTLPDHAVAGNTPVNQPPGPYVVPGKYELVLTIDGQTFRHTLNVALDPRVKVSPDELQAQLDLARAMDAWMNQSFHSFNEASSLRTALAAARKGIADDSLIAGVIQGLTKDVSEIAEGTGNSTGFGSINRDLARYVAMIQSADARPAKSIADTAAPLCKALVEDLNRWRQINEVRVPQLNQGLQQLRLAPLPVAAAEKAPVCPN
jgi:hypothetical protein